MADSPHWVRDYVSGDLPVTFDASGSSRADWLQAIGAGTVAVTCEDGSASTLTLAAGQSIPGPFRSCTAMTASAVRFGRGELPSTGGAGALYVAAADLASTASGLGASLVGVAASGNDLETDLAAVVADAAQGIADAAAAQGDATQALADAATAQGTADAAVPLASVQQAVGTMVAGSVTFAAFTLTASSVVVPIKEVEDGAASGALTVGAITPGAPGSVTITSDDNAETSTIRALVIG